MQFIRYWNSLKQENDEKEQQNYNWNNNGRSFGYRTEIIIKSFERKSVRNGRIIIIGDFNIMQMVYDLIKPTVFLEKSLMQVNVISVHPV